jgi:hypothetical protein
MKAPGSGSADERMMKRASKQVGVVVAMALALGFAGSVLAQQGSSAVVGGTTTDATSAGNENGGGMPQIQHEGAVSYVSGGVGLDESTALKQAEHHWPLAMRFTGPTADYLADVHVRIVGPQGADVLSTDSRGPYMLVKLPPGRYTVHARYKDEEQTRTVTVSSEPGARADFHWNIQ